MPRSEPSNHVEQDPRDRAHTPRPPTDVPILPESSSSGPGSAEQFTQEARRTSTWDPMNTPPKAPPLVVTIGHAELIIRRRYEVASIANDVLVAVWFLIGSILFFSSETTTAGTWLFVIGSIELMIRPLLRLGRRVHLGRLGAPGAPAESDDDF